MSTLSCGLLTWNSGSRLIGWVKAARVYSDQIIIGVDNASDDLTYDLACRLADVVFRFEHAPVIDAAYMHCFTYATSDWLLMLADDERLAPERVNWHLESLLADERFTHYWLPTQFIISLHPNIAYINAPPYYPDYHVRLMRNDVDLVTQVPGWHTGLQMSGAWSYQEGFPIRHYERVMRTSVEREQKVLRSRAIGWPASMEAVYLGGDDLPRVELPWTAHPEYVFIKDLNQSRYGAYQAQVISGIQSADWRGSVHAT